MYSFIFNMFKTLIILKPAVSGPNYGVTVGRSNRGQSFPHWLASESWPRLCRVVAQKRGAWPSIGLSITTRQSPNEKETGIQDQFRLGCWGCQTRI